MSNRRSILVLTVAIAALVAANVLIDRAPDAQSIGVPEDCDEGQYGH